METRHCLKATFEPGPDEIHRIPVEKLDYSTAVESIASILRPARRLVSLQYLDEDKARPAHTPPSEFPIPENYSLPFPPALQDRVTVSSQPEFEEMLRQVFIARWPRYGFATRPTEAQVRECQQRLFGPFFKRNLPYGIEGADSFDLELLALEHSTDALEAVSRAMCKKFGAAALLAKSGSGKTATIVALCKRRFVILISCAFAPAPTGGASRFFNDRNCCKLEQEAIELATAAGDPSSRESKEPARSIVYFSSVRLRALREALARMLFLAVLLRQKPELTPEDFLREQAGEAGKELVGRLVAFACKVHDTDVETMCIGVRKLVERMSVVRLQRKEDPGRVGEDLGRVVFALDEAQALLFNSIWHVPVSEMTQQPRDMDEFLSVDVPVHKRRMGILSPVVSALSFCGNLIISGTQFALHEADQALSAVAREFAQHFEKIVDFGVCLSPFELFSTLLNMDDISESPTLRKIGGRWRFPSSVIVKLTKEDGNAQQARREIEKDLHQQGADPTEPDAVRAIKSAMFSAAVQEAYDCSKCIIRDRVREVLDADSKLIAIFTEMVAASMFTGKKGFVVDDLTLDLVSYALCRLNIDKETHMVSFSVDEELVFTVLRSVLEHDYNISPTLWTAFEELRRVVVRDPTSASKGSYVETLALEALLGFEGVRVSDLPFLHGLKLPAWCARSTMRFCELGEASRWVRDEIGCKADATFLTLPAVKRCQWLLAPELLTRPDGIGCIVEDEPYNRWVAALEAADKELQGDMVAAADKTAHELALSCKCYTSSLDDDKTAADIDSTCSANWFLSKRDKEGEFKVYLGAQPARTLFQDSGVLARCSSTGQLRIHVMLPKASSELVTQVHGEDVLVFINKDNLSSLFCTDKGLHKQAGTMCTILRTLERLLEALAAASTAKRKKRRMTAVAMATPQQDQPMTGVSEDEHKQEKPTKRVKRDEK
eukprot:m51a1_g6953 hypothetical protein (948) ;mRNA; f:43539-46682